MQGVLRSSQHSDGIPAGLPVNKLVHLVDTSVYTRNRAFRLLHSRKHGKPNPFVLGPGMTSG